MDLTLIGAQIQDLLIKNESVILPGAGKLVIESRPASFLEDGITIVPPRKVLVFEQECRAEDCAMNGCTEWQEELSGIMKEALVQDGKFEISGVGSFADNGAGEIIFTVNEDFNFSPDNFSLESISLEVAVPEPEVAKESILEEPGPAEQAQDMSGHDITARRNARKKWLMWLLVIVAALAVMVLFVILFKEDLRPLLEKMLYTEEELEIMQKWATR